MRDAPGWVASLWENTFHDLLDYHLDNDDPWSFQFNYSLENRLSAEERNRGWKVSMPCAKGSFQCGSCQNIWFSARVMVLFHYRLRRGRGTVIMRPFGQACRGCRSDFYLPGFTDSEVENILVKLFNKIRKNCYMENIPDNNLPQTTKKYTKPHETQFCEACRDGICCQDEN